MTFLRTLSHAVRPKKPYASVAIPPAPVLVPSQRPISRSVTSITNDKGDNERMSGVVHRSPGIYLTAEETPVNLS